MSPFLRVMRDLSLLVGRIALGVILLLRGVERFRVGMTAQVDALAHQGVPQPALFAWGATLLEIVGGILLVLGLLTPVVAALAVAEMVMVIAFFSWYRGFDVAHQGWEHHLALAALALFPALNGGGRLALDRLLFRRRRTTKGATAVDTTAYPA